MDPAIPSSRLGGGGSDHSPPAARRKHRGRRPATTGTSTGLAAGPRRTYGNSANQLCSAGALAPGRLQSFQRITVWVKDVDLVRMARAKHLLIVDDFDAHAVVQRRHLIRRLAVVRE